MLKYNHAVREALKAYYNIIRMLRLKASEIEMTSIQSRFTYILLRK
jgi:hypothetical protein